MRYVLMPFQFAGTAFAFALFGIGGVIFGLLITPVLKMTSKSPEEERRRARAVVRWWFGRFVAIITALRLVRVEVRNPEALMKEGAILACSHPSLIDVVCLLSVVPEATTIVKAALLRNIFTRAPIRAAGYVSNAEGPDAIEKLARDGLRHIPRRHPDAERIPGGRNAAASPGRRAARASHGALDHAGPHHREPALAHQGPRLVAFA